MGAGAETTLTLVLHQNAGQGRTLGRFRLSATTDPRPVVTEPGLAITKEIVEIAAKDPRAAHEGGAGDADAASTGGSLPSWRRCAPPCAPRSCAKADARARTSRSRWSRPRQEPEPVRILPRGNWLDESGEVVEPAVPHFLPPDRDRRAGGPRASTSRAG